MKESENFDPNFARLASGSEQYIESYYEKAGKKIFNLQLRYWIEALIKFERLDKECNIKLEELLLILNSICNSLLVLAGVNFKKLPQNDFIPCLIDLYDQWSLKKDEPELFHDLRQMNENYNKLSKHLCKSSLRSKLLNKIDYEKIRKYMNVTKEIWLWALKKRYGDNIPEDQLTFFEIEF